MIKQVYMIIDDVSTEPVETYIANNDVQAIQTFRNVIRKVAQDGTLLSLVKLGFAQTEGDGIKRASFKFTLNTKLLLRYPEQNEVKAEKEVEEEINNERLQ